MSYYRFHRLFPNKKIPKLTKAYKKYQYTTRLNYSILEKTIFTNLPLSYTHSLPNISFPCPLRKIVIIH